MEGLLPSYTFKVPLSAQDRQSAAPAGRRGKVGDKGIYTVQNFQRGEKEVKKCPTQGSKKQ